MNTDVFGLTLRMLMGRRRTLILLLVALIPVLIALAFRLSAGDDENPIDFTANGLLGGMVVAIFLPLAALVFGTAAFGAEAEDGTVVYILARPLPRWTIVTAKLAATLLATSIIVLPAGLISAIIALGGADGGPSLIAGFAVGLLAGTLAYSALFLCLGVVTSRAFVAGLAYVFIWEGVVTSIFSGTRNFSIREYVLGIAGGIADIPERLFDPGVSIGTGIIMTVVVTAITLFIAIRGVQRFQFGEGA